ncbi:MAG: hypothetical protein AAGH70_06250 [Pseudomonadota bacterium]
MIRQLALAAALAALSLPATAATIENGSFEDLGGQTIIGSWEIFAGVPGWTGNPNIEIQTDATISAVDAQDGDNYAELDTNTNSTITQDVYFDVGLYELVFFYSPRVNIVPTSTNDLSFGLSSVFADSILGAPNSVAPWGEWTEVTTEFLVSSAGTYSLFFSAIGEQNTAGCGDCGALIDNISVAAIPLPAGLVLLLTGLAALLGFRRRA